jgi:hypothetical protein
MKAAESAKIKLIQSLDNEKLLHFNTQTTEMGTDSIKFYGIAIKITILT